MSIRASGRYVTTTVAGTTVRAFVPAPLPPRLDDTQRAQLAEPLRAAEAALSRLDLAGEMIPSLDWFIHAFIRKEALLSSEIEGTQATLVDVLSFEQTERTGESNPADLEEVANYVAAVHQAFAQIHSPRGVPLSVRLLNDCHRTLMSGVRGAHKQPGAFRRSQNWVGGGDPGQATFVPPPPEQVIDLMGDLERYVHADDSLPALVRVAVVHAQFETIHPYLDGNGRLGRMLIALLLDHWHLLGSPLLYLSLFLKQHRGEYYAALSAVREESDWLRWLQFFLRGVNEIADQAVDVARALFAQVTADRQRLLATGGATVTALQLFEQLPNHPVTSMPQVTRLLAVTKPTASKAIAVLVADGVLVEIGARRRDRVYRYAAYLDALG